jgi:List-Bact-rpt repeat protein
MSLSWVRTALGLLLISGCGGGDNNVTNPPADQSFTLTVTGNGTGSGRVISSAGVSPIDCNLAGTATPTGICSVTYPEGTVVTLTVTPAAGSGFDGWDNDAASCGTNPSCPLTVNANQTATARLSTSL